MTRSELSRRDLLRTLGALPAAADDAVADPVLDAPFADALAGTATDDSPWYMRLFVGVGTWLGAVFIGAFLVSMHVVDEESALILGAPLLIAACFLSHRPFGRSIFGHQLVWVATVAGQILVLVAAFERVDLSESLLLMMALTQVPLVVGIRARGLRLAMVTLCLVLTILWVGTHDLPVLTDLTVLAILAGTSALWIQRDRILASGLGPFWFALGSGGVLAPALLYSIVGVSGVDDHVVVQPLLWCFVAALCGGWVLVTGFREAGMWAEGNPDRATLGSTLGPWLLLAALVATFDVGHELPMLLVLLLLAQLRRSRGLAWIGIVLLGLFLWRFYYDTTNPLLDKSGALLALAVVCVGTWLWHARPTAAHDSSDHAAVSLVPASRRPQALRLAAALAVAIGLLALSIADREWIVRTGRTVLLELRPVDPRSLMQGDYMRLGYAFDRDVSFGAGAHAGVLYFRLDDDGIGHYVDHHPSLFGAREAKADEQRLRYRQRYGRVQIGAESFLFEEGTAEIYQDARFGELRVSPSGRAVLVGLRDADLRPLGRAADRPRPGR